MKELQEFLKISRYVILSSLPQKVRPKFSNFILKETTDYQILSILIDAKIPTEYNQIHYQELLSELYRQISVGCEYLREQDKSEKIKQFAVAMPTAPLIYPVISLLKTIGALSGAAAIASKLGAGSMSGVVGGIGALVVASLLVYAAWKTYQRFLSPAARACKNLKNKEKTKCIIKFKIQARRKQYMDLVAAKHACDKSKIPIKCRRVVEEKIKSIQKKIDKLREKLEAI
jgi:hypothetical protein